MSLAVFRNELAVVTFDVMNHNDGVIKRDV